MVQLCWLTFISIAIGFIHRPDAVDIAGIYEYKSAQDCHYDYNTWSVQQLSLMAEIEYKDNIIWNVKKLLDKEGRPLKRGNFKNGNGTLHIYRENGVLLRKIEIKNGALNGICTYYYSTGQVLMTGNYVNNNQYGVWTEYDIQGRVVQQPEYGSRNFISSD
jgi:antitoxin component YwqK of YwqJK toxin-antitoxin module